MVMIAAANTTCAQESFLFDRLFPGLCHLPFKIFSNSQNSNRLLLYWVLSCATHRPRVSVYILSGRLHSSLDLIYTLTLP